jgi:hypothetical protein
LSAFSDLVYTLSELLGVKNSIFFKVKTSFLLKTYTLTAQEAKIIPPCQAKTRKKALF